MYVIEQSIIKTEEIIASEELKRLNSALAQLPCEQREVILLHLQGGLRFTEIAGLQNVSIKTAQSRCRYGLDKLRSLLDSETEKLARRMT